MFSKRHRLTRKQFDTYFKSGRRIHSPDITLIYTPLPETHAAVVVGKKVARKAHDRNKIRRRLYGAMYRTLQATDQTGVYILIAKPTLAALSKQDQIERVQKILNRISITR
jgi:ribonuclease P protein component